MTSEEKGREKGGVYRSPGYTLGYSFKTLAIRRFRWYSMMMDIVYL